MNTLVLAANAGAYCYPWANMQTINGSVIRVVQPEAGLQLAPFFEKIVLINGLQTNWLFHPAWKEKDSYFFLWDPARCPRYAPGADVLKLLKTQHKVYSFQQEDCDAFGLRFNSTMYAAPPPALYPPEPLRYDVLFLGVPKDRLPLLRELHGQCLKLGLKTKFQIGLTFLDRIEPEQSEGWNITREWTGYTDYLHWVQQSRALLDIYQAIQTGYSLRVMEHIFFGKKLITNNALIEQAAFYHPNNIFLLQKDDINGLKDWLDLPFAAIADEIKAYYKFENWAERFI